MKVINKSRKIIGINNSPLLPGEELELTAEMEKHPSVLFYLSKGILADTDKVSDSLENANALDAKRIAEEAVAKYKEEQEKKENEIKYVQTMKKAELLKKAAGLGLEVKDDITVDALKEKIVAELRK